MNNLSNNTVLPFTAATYDYGRFINIMVMTIIIPLFLLFGFIALKSDFAKPGFTTSGTINNMSANYTDRNPEGLRHINNGADNAFAANNNYMIGIRGAILCPEWPDRIPMIPVDKDCDRIERPTMESYRSTDLVDSPPELIWMKYPDLNKEAGFDLQLVKVSLSILVDYTGKPLEVNFENDTTIDDITKKVIVQSVESSLFRPAQVDNQAVGCWITIPMEFEV